MLPRTGAESKYGKGWVGCDIGAISRVVPATGSGTTGTAHGSICSTFLTEIFGPWWHEACCSAGTTMRTITLVLASILVIPACGGQALESQDPGVVDSGSPLPDGSHPTPDGSALPDATADATVPPGPVPAQGQKILFELAYVNYAWGNAINGHYVTVDGKVYQYDYFGSGTSDGAIPDVQLKPNMTEAQVMDRYGVNPKLVASVDPGTLLSKFAQVGAARNGALLSQGGCADYGEQNYVAWLYDSASSRYTPVVLGIDGDWAAKNTATEGDQLIEWIRSVIGLEGTRMCQYRTSICQGTLCPGVPPCAEGSVPMNPGANGCLEYCGQPSQCEKVDSCAVCAKSKQACLLDQNGIAHCLSWISGCQQTVDCACGGDSLCAGMSAFCHGDAVNGLSCSAP